MSTTYRNYYVTVARRRFGFEYSRVHIAGEPYLDRFIVYIGGPTLRLHRFWRGDDDRAPHDHPWWFITFPLTDYVEAVYRPASVYTLPAASWVRVVKAFRFHFRPAKFRHIVIGPWGGKVWRRALDKLPPKPFWTFVITGANTNKWGFWPKPDQFVYWRNWPAAQSAERTRE